MTTKVFDYVANRHILIDVTGRKLTRGLFRELAVNAADRAECPFSLAAWRQVYVSLADPTDYLACQALLGSWDHWQALLRCEDIATAVAEWRHEVDAKLRSEAIVQLREQAKGAKGTAAARWLAEVGGTSKKTLRQRKVETENPEHVRMLETAHKLSINGTTP